MLALFALAALSISPPAGGTPYRAPQLAASSKLVALAFGSGHAIFVSTSKDLGATFSAPVKVTEAGVLPLGRHRGPRIALTKRAIVVTAVAGNTEATGPHAHGLPSDGDLFAWHSVDGGKTWSRGARINNVPGSAREGLHALASDARGGLFAVWLDLRGTGTQLYGAFSDDSGATWSKNQLVYESPDGTVCQCCHPSASFAADGTLTVMWRNDLDGARDFYMVSAKPGKPFGPAQKLGLGTWKINACPMDGGGIAHQGNQVVTAWRREGDLFLDKPGQPEVKIGQGKDIAIAAEAGQLYVAWIAEGKLELWKDGKARTLSESAALPSVVMLPDGQALLAWEDSQGISVQSAN